MEGTHHSARSHSRCLLGATGPCWRSFCIFLHLHLHLHLHAAQGNSEFVSCSGSGDPVRRGRATGTIGPGGVAGRQQAGKAGQAPHGVSGVGLLAEHALQPRRHRADAAAVHAVVAPRARGPRPAQQRRRGWGSAAPGSARTPTCCRWGCCRRGPGPADETGCCPGAACCHFAAVRSRCGSGLRNRMQAF